MGTSPSALLVPLLVAVLGGPIAATHPKTGVEHTTRLTAAQQRATVRYWTQDRMTHATTPERSRVHFLAAGSRQQSSASSSGAAWRSGGRVGATTGKVFFTLNGRDFVCSAGTVTSANHDLVVTAGHCVKDGTGAWAQNWIFVPGYHDGLSPYGGFTARHMYVPDRWAGSAADEDDFAMVALDTSDGRHVTDVVGAQGIAFGQPHGRQTYAFGYPATGSYNGEELAYCSGRPHDDPHGLAGEQGLRCTMTQGSSGGVWLSRFDPATGIGLITSVSSFKYADDSATMYGPAFGDTAQSLYEQAQHG